MCFFSNKVVFFPHQSCLPLFFLSFFRVVCHRPFAMYFYRRAVAACFVTDLLRWVVVLPTVSFFMVFTLAVQMTKFDPTESSDQILFVNILHIWNLRYFKYC